MKLGAIGYGKMGGAIVDAVADNGIELSLESVSVFDVSGVAKQRIIEKGYRFAEKEEIFAECDVVLLAVKPQDHCDL